MALENGTVTVDDDGVASGGGLARSLYDQLVAANIDPYAGTIAVSSIVAAKKGLATYTNTLAAGIVPYLKSNGQAKIEAGVAGQGLQRTPNPNNPGTDTAAPLIDMFIPLV